MWKHIFSGVSKDVLTIIEDETNNVFFNRQSNCLNFREIPTVAESSTKIRFLRSEVMLSMDELNLDQAPQNIGLPSEAEENCDLIVLHDMMNDVTSEISQMFTMGSHHKKYSIILITQSFSESEIYERY
ncbi:hypothetical protein TNCV_189341 [Trichonephila clavipes]|nr:hypothetical protein TNCV_189341 [Trichonephila clavipes]